jgi:hypothetical protein
LREQVFQTCEEPFIPDLLEGPEEPNDPEEHEVFEVYEGSDVPDVPEVPEGILLLPAKISELKTPISKVETRISVHIFMQYTLQGASSMRFF